jgi:hypothetical protein
MVPIKDKVLHVDRIVALWEHLIGFILKQIIDLKGEFYHDGHPIHRESATS